jgi:hypothetical protein
MYYVKFERLPNGAYTIIDHTDERLFLFGELLLDDDIRGYVKTELEDFPDIKEGEIVSFHTARHSKITFQRVQEKYILIKLFNPDRYHNVLETDIAIDKLVDLVQDWEDLAYQEAPEIYVLRDHDKDTFRVSETRI